MSGGVWVWLILARIHNLVNDLRTASEVDQAYAANTTHAPVTVADGLRNAAAPFGIDLPSDTGKLLALLRRDGTPVPVEGAPRGAVVLLDNGRLGVIANGGTIESNGRGLSLVDPTPGRNVAAWLIPGVLHVYGGSK